MGSTFTVVVIIGAAILACAAFGLALRLQGPLPPPAARRSPAATRRSAQQAADGGEGPVQVSNSHAAMRLGEPKTVSPSGAADKSSLAEVGLGEDGPARVASLPA